MFREIFILLIVTAQYCRNPLLITFVQLTAIGQPNSNNNKSTNSDQRNRYNRRLGLLCSFFFLVLWRLFTFVVVVIANIFLCCCCDLLLQNRQTCAEVWYFNQHQTDANEAKLDFVDFSLGRGSTCVCVREGVCLLTDNTMCWCILDEISVDFPRRIADSWLNEIYWRLTAKLLLYSTQLNIRRILNVRYKYIA